MGGLPLIPDRRVLAAQGAVEVAPHNPGGQPELAHLLFRKETMRTQLIEGNQPRADDQDLLALVEAHAAKGRQAVAGRQYARMAIRNEAGAIYRAIITSGPREHRAIHEALRGYGLHDELRGLSNGQFEAIFGDAVAPSAVRRRG